MIAVYADIMIFIVELRQIVKKWLTPYCSRVSYSIPYIDIFKAYFVLSIGIDLGGFSTKYCNKSLIMYDIERSYPFDINSRNAFISSVVRKFKGTDLVYFIVVQCNIIIICHSIVKSLYWQCNVVQCNTYNK